MPDMTPYTKIDPPPQSDRNRWELASPRTDTDGVRRYYCVETQEYWDDPKQGKELSTWVDKAMFEAEDIESGALKAPKVYLLSATPDPLGSIAAAMMMYEGRVVRDLNEITNEERVEYFNECFKTALRAPFEFVDFHFMVEGVTRAHTHQEVRQRTAVFAQESMRFAVKENIAARPGPITASDKRAKEAWDETMDFLWDKYNWLVNNGVPAEEARGILPHDTLTRLHHKVNLRNLIDELGKRTCTQAQFEWRMWAASVREAIKTHHAFVADPGSIRSEHDAWDFPNADLTNLDEPDVGPPRHLARFPDSAEGRYNGWQFKMIADSPIFQPICFESGRCMFKAKMDRGCTIRERVENGQFDLIDTAEWLMDPTAGWSR
jgi:flavin-dependent thymidylate synthase